MFNAFVARKNTKRNATSEEKKKKYERFLSILSYIKFFPKSSKKKIINKIIV